MYVRKNKVIGSLRGIIIEKQPPQILLEVHGIGYEIFMPMTCFHAMPDTSQEVVIFTHCVVRKDAQLVFGFINKQERILFCELIKINGIGTKLALAILSGMSAQQLINAVEHQKIDVIVKLPGVGRKTAERLIIAMRGKFNTLLNNLSTLQMVSKAYNTIDKPTISTDSTDEAVAALVALGYKPQEATWMISKVASVDANCEMLIRDALRTTL